MTDTAKRPDPPQVTLTIDKHGRNRPMLEAIEDLAVELERPVAWVARMLLEESPTLKAVMGEKPCDIHSLGLDLCRKPSTWRKATLGKKRKGTI